jgi:hypothetical protein
MQGFAVSSCIGFRKNVDGRSFSSSPWITDFKNILLNQVRAEEIIGIGLPSPEGGHEKPKSWDSNAFQCCQA